VKEYFVVLNIGLAGEAAVDLIENFLGIFDLYSCFTAKTNVIITD
jgi:hypothetical protein